jgi:hypothetical protein
LPISNQLSSKSITDQVKAIKNFVYIIEVRWATLTFFNQNSVGFTLS